MLTIHLVPVGKTDLSPNGELLGLNNPALDSAGVSNSDQIADSLRDVILEAVFSGPLKRQIITARRIATPHSLPIRAEKDLMDINYGRWSGSTWTDIEREDPALTLKIRKSPQRFRFPSGEKMKKALKRLHTFSRYLLGNFGFGHVVVVADDFVLMMLTSIIAGVDFESLDPWKPTGGRPTVIEIDGGGRRVVLIRGESPPMDP